MSPDPLREPWRSALEPKGVRSKRGLATKAGISPQTAKRLIDGEGNPSPDTVAAVADSLFNGDRNRVWELAGYDVQDHGDWQLPPEASQLNQEQRDAVLAVVRAMLPPDVRRGDGNAGRDATSMSDREKARLYDAIMGDGNITTMFSRLSQQGVRLTRDDIENAYESAYVNELHEDIAARQSTD